MLFQGFGKGLRQEEFAVPAHVIQFLVELDEIVRGAHDASVGVAMGYVEGMADLVDSDLDRALKEVFARNRLIACPCPEPE